MSNKQERKRKNVCNERLIFININLMKYLEWLCSQFAIKFMCVSVSVDVGGENFFISFLPFVEPFCVSSQSASSKQRYFCRAVMCNNCSFKRRSIKKFLLLTKASSTLMPVLLLSLFLFDCWHKCQSCLPIYLVSLDSATEKRAKKRLVAAQKSSLHSREQRD